MTPTEMKAYFLAEYDAATSLSAPGWDNNEISSFLNIAQDLIVTELTTNKKTDRLGEIINVVILPTYVHANITNAMYASTSEFTDVSNYFIYVSSQTKLYRINPTINNKWIPNELIDITIAPKFYKTEFNSPWFKYPKVFMEVNSNNPKFIILVDAYTEVDEYSFELTYVRKPTRINIDTSVNTELNESLHQMIVKSAVEEAVKSIRIAKVANQ